MFEAPKYFSTPEGMYGSKAVDKTLLGVSSKIGEAKSKKELEFFECKKFLLVAKCCSTNIALWGRNGSSGSSIFL